MPVAFFCSVHFTSSSHITDLKCFAYKANEARCGRTLSSRRLSRIDELHAKLDSGTEEHIDDDERYRILEELASICLCGSHNKEYYVRAAVHQWTAELQSRTNKSFLDNTATKSSNGGVCTTLDVKRYREKGAEQGESTSTEAKQTKAMNLKMTLKLLDQISNDPNESDHLYCFSHPTTPGLFKVGSTKRMGRITQEHELCYPELDLYCFDKCPNAKLFEKLVHGEFSQHQQPRICTKCRTKPTEHKEWFKAPVEELLSSIKDWSQFSRMLYCDNTQARLDELQVATGVGNLSKDPAMLRKWAKEKVDLWLRKTCGSTAARIVEAGNTAKLSYDSEYPSSPVPELSPGSSAPGTPESLLDPPTPTTGSRIRKERHIYVRSEAILEMSTANSTISFLSSTTGVDVDSQITLVESAQPDAKSRDTFRDSMPGGYISESTTEANTPRGSVDGVGVDMPSTPTPAAQRKGPVSAGTRPLISPNLVPGHVAGPTAFSDLSGQGAKKSDGFGLVERMRRLVFSP
ncbi:GIY-YIG nuclease family protein [Aspergillus foveolatus]|uniref:GIY-YIG nuclease family protein n=1 Tax=Aspergillus foveolatus TaxID=210207 RepID=UPI003CCE017F